MMVWEKKSFPEVIADKTSGNTKTLQSEFLPSRLYPIVDQGKELIAGFTNDKSRLCKAELPVIIFGDHTKCLKFVDFPFCLGADGTKVLRPKIGIDERYLFQALQTIRIPEAGYSRHFKYLKRGDIPLPPLAEQKQIAEILDQADELRHLRQCTIDRLNTLGQVIFYEMFGDPTTNSKGWKTGTIRDLIREAKYGTSKKANTDGCGIPVLRMSNVTYQGELDLSDLKHVELSETELQKYTAQEDDILFNRTNSKELVGKTAVFNLPNLMVLAGYLVRARVNEQADPYYISAYMNSPHGKTTLQNMCKNIVGMANINAQEFQNIAIAIPPIEKQKSFRKKIEKIAKQKESLLNALTMYKNLFSSLQQRAFRGEL